MRIFLSIFCLWLGAETAFGQLSAQQMFLNGKPAAGSISVPNPAVRYELNGDATDSSGNGWNGTLVGSPSFVTGVGGYQALSLNGSNQYMTNLFNLSLSNFTATVWVDALALKSTGRIVDKNFQTGFWLGQSAFTTTNFGGGIMVSTSPYGYFSQGILNTWTFLAMVRNGTNESIYVNSQLTTNGWCSSSLTDYSTLAVGTESGSTHSTFFAEYLQDIQLWTNVLTQSQIASVQANVK